MMYDMYTKFEWFVNHILLFSQSAHATHEMYTDYGPVWGSLRLAPTRLDYIYLYISNKV